MKKTACVISTMALAFAIFFMAGLKSAAAQDIDILVNLTISDGLIMFYTGTSGGIEEGKTYEATAGGQTAGVIEIVKAEKSYSKAKVLEGDIKEGDKLTLTEPSSEKPAKAKKLSAKGSPSSSGLKTLKTDEEEEADESDKEKSAVEKKKKAKKEEAEDEEDSAKKKEKPVAKSKEESKEDKGPKPAKGRMDKPGEITGFQVRYGQLSFSGDSNIEKLGGTLEADKGYGLGYRMRNFQVLYNVYDFDASLGGLNYSSKMKGLAVNYIRRFDEESPAGWYAGLGRLDYGLDVSLPPGDDRYKAWSLLVGYDLVQRASVEFSLNISDDDDFANSNALSLSYTF